jgi:hypothetical protein
LQWPPPWRHVLKAGFHFQAAPGLSGNAVNNPLKYVVAFRGLRALTPP